ncbi:MAG: azoreductase [Paenibacillus sp.]|jgi:FMN-dependent NADH-azoreductase|nr:azoreductase [Paenibacillus sp.]
MANVLFIKANDRPAGQAVSVQMYETFLQAYRQSHPEDQITELDLYQVELPYYGNTAITALYKQNQGMDLTQEEQKTADLVNVYLDQFLAADTVIMAFPLWNFTAPAPLITYLSYLSQTGKTFKYTAEGPIGLAGDKRVILLNARGGVYSTGPMDGAEGALRVVRTSLGLFGISPEEVIIEGHNQFPDRAQEIVKAGLLETETLALQV